MACPLRSFFGKIFCSEKDYNIVEATEVDPPADEQYDNDMEKRREDALFRKRIRQCMVHVAAAGRYGSCQGVCWRYPGVADQSTVSGSKM